MVNLNIYYYRSFSPMWPFTLAYIRVLTFYNCWRQVLHINTKCSYSLIIYWNKFHSDIISELLINVLKENSSEQKLLYFFFPAWVLG